MTYDIKNIKVIDNFMSKDETKELIYACENETDHVWWYQKFPGPEYAMHALGEYQKLCTDMTVGYHSQKNPILKKYIEKLSNTISYDIGKKLIPIFHFNKHTVMPDKETAPHTDAGSKHMDDIDYLSDYSPKHCYEPCLSEYTAIIYLNDNYDGGNLYFPEYNLEINHTPGQLVYFPAGAEYAHGVSMVKNHARWNLITHLTSPLLIQMHSIIYNMWSTMTVEQKKSFPSDWENNHIAKGIRS